jgi:hypothetical protein
MPVRSKRDQRDELKLAEKIMNGPLNGWRARCSGRVTQQRVGHEHPRSNEAEAKDAWHDGSPGGTTSCSCTQDTSEADVKTEQKRFADEVVGDLYPQRRKVR